METQTFDDVFDALAATPADSANLKTRADLLAALIDQVTSWDLREEAAASRLGVTRPRLDDLLEGRLANFSLAALIDLVFAAGLMLDIKVARVA